MQWNRLDVAGTDECKLSRHAGGWLLEGVAQFGTGAEAAHLAYAVEADAMWRTRRGSVRGTAGGRTLALAIERSATAEWRVDGIAAPELAGLIDLDLGFTPATNLFPVRRLALKVGDAVDAPAAWLDDETWTFARLPQRYERRSADHYWYESPTTGYSGLLSVSSDGFVLHYPGLWHAVTLGTPPPPRA